MSGSPLGRHRLKVHPTRLAWLILGLTILGVVGVVIGSRTLWIIAVGVFVIVVLLLLGPPVNVRERDLPPEEFERRLRNRERW